MSKLPMPLFRARIGGMGNGGSCPRQTPGEPRRNNESPATGANAAGQVGEPLSPQLGALRRLHTIAETAEVLQLSDSTIRRAIHLAAIKVGRIVRLTAGDVEAWVNRLRRKTR